MFSVFKHFSIWTGAIVLKNLKYNSNLQRETASRVGHVLIEFMFVIGWYLTKYNKHFTSPDKKYWIFGCNLIWLLNLNPTSETMWNGLGSGLLISIAGKTQLIPFAHPTFTCSKLKVNRNTRTKCEIYSKLTIKTPCSSVSIVNFEHVIACWMIYQKLLKMRRSYFCPKLSGVAILSLLLKRDALILWNFDSRFTVKRRNNFLINRNALWKHWLKFGSGSLFHSM